MLSNDDAYWHEHLELFTTRLPRYQEEQTIWGRTHVEEERLSSWQSPVFHAYPLPQTGTRYYAGLEPYLHEIVYRFGIGLYPQPRGTAIGEVVIPAAPDEIQILKLGNAFAYVYPSVRTIAIWEAYLASVYRTGTVAQDPSMQRLWEALERWLLARWPATELLITADHDPIAEPDDYHALLASRGFAPVADGVYGKRLPR